MTPPSQTAANRSATPILPVLVGAPLVMFAALWAFAPLEEPTLPSLPDARPDGRGQGGDASTLVALDRSAFRAPLWVVHPPAPPATPAASPPAPPPFKLQLLAIITGQAQGNHGAYKAMLYDPDQDKVLILGPGESISGDTAGDPKATIESIDANGLSIKDDRAAVTRVLTLQGPPGGNG